MATPTTTLKAFRRRPAVEQAPLVAVYAVRQGPTRWAVWLVSRKVPGHPYLDAGFTPVVVNLPFAKASQVTLHQLAGPYNSHNVGPRQVAVESRALGNSAVRGGKLVLGGQATVAPDGLAPASTLLFVFEGTSP